MRAILGDPDRFCYLNHVLTKRRAITGDRLGDSRTEEHVFPGRGYGCKKESFSDAAM